MGQNRSFTEYVKKQFDNEFWAVAEDYLKNDFEIDNVQLYKLHRVGEIEISNVNVEHVWVYDQPGMNIKFDVALSVVFDIHEGDYHYDEYEEKTIWVMVSCHGNLDKALDDFKIDDVTAYNGKDKNQNPLDDSLVPYIPYEQLEKVAKEFLDDVYPEALRVPFHGQKPVWVDPTMVAKRLGLSIVQQQINSKSTIFGQLYFVDTERKLYNSKSGKETLQKVPGKTIIVDPTVFLLRNIGCLNNTIIHECVHWYKHRKAFKLEQLFNRGASCISCEIEGEAESAASKKSTEFMEKQANHLAPRIQMPKEPFIAKAKEYITKYIRELNAMHSCDVMEIVIDQLAIDFGVSRQAAKIRLVDLGFEDAVGTFTYVDGHYVKPHGFKKGALELNQTFTIGVVDAAIERMKNPELREKIDSGDYIFIDNHYVYNAPLYVVSDDSGRLDLTDYARAHMDECCLVFDLSIKSSISSTYHSICFLNREYSDVTFEVAYHNGYQNAPQDKQVALRKKQQSEWIEIRKKMTDDPEQCMDLLLDWRKMKYTELGDAIDINEKTIRRTVKGETSPRLETAVLICFALNLPPTISEKLLDVLGCKLKPMNPKHQWISEALHIMYPQPVDITREWLREYEVEL